MHSLNCARTSDIYQMSSRPGRGWWRSDAAACEVFPETTATPRFGGELLRLDPGGFDDPGGGFALAQHEAREVGLRRAHRFATVF